MTTMTGQKTSGIASPPQAATAKPRVSPRPRRAPVVEDENTVIVPAGAYYLGDPCYAFYNDDEGYEQWANLLESSGTFGCDSDGGPVGRVTVPAKPGSGSTDTTDIFVVAFDTAYGDGGFFDRDGFNYSVDAGLIGLVPAWFAVANLRAHGATDLSHLTTTARFVVFETDVVCTKGGPDEGLLSFGPIEVVTHDEPETCGRCERTTDATGYCTWGCDDEVECPDGCGQSETDCICGADDDDTDGDDD